MNALRHGLAATESGSMRWEQKSSPTLMEVNHRLQQIELERLKLLRRTDQILAGRSRGLHSILQKLAALERYLKRAQARLSKPVS
jgi:hypothetical protein